MKAIAASITAPHGFQAAGVACGLKKDGRPDLALVVSDRPAVVAGVFTRNRVKGHSLQLSQENCRGHVARAVVVNSGNANACIGEPGFQDARAMAASVASWLGCPDSQVLTGSTGVIGKRLDMDAVTRGIGAAFTGLSASADAGHRAEQAIMTTDRVPKESAVCLEIGGKTVTVAGMAKGSGMIHPNMATMIALLTTDCAVGSELLGKLLRRVVDRTFNRVSVDGDTSVCDMVLALANGAAGNQAVQDQTPESDLLEQALDHVCTFLSRLIAQDGEGATKLIEVRANGARTMDDAYKIVLAVARSPLVKTAVFGEDANVGRILTAAGYSGADFDPADCDIFLGSLKVCARGNVLPFDEDQAREILQQKEILIQIDLNEGSGADRIWTCDFSYDYVKINGSYRS